MTRPASRLAGSRADSAGNHEQPIAVGKLHRDAFRQRSNYIVALASEPFQGAVRFISRALTGPASEPAAWRRGLILSHSHLGDVLYRTGSLPALSQGLPRCDWSFLTTPRAAPLLAHNPALREVLPLLDEHGASLPSQALEDLRRRRFDVVLCTNTFRGLHDLLLSVRLRAPNRVAYAFKGFAGLATRAVTVHYPSPYPAYFRDMVASLTGVPPAWSLRPKVYLTQAEHDRAYAALRSVGAGERPFLVCAPRTRQRSGGAPTELFVSVLRSLSGRFEGDVVLCGDASERALLDAMRETVGGRTFVLAGELDVRGFAALITRSVAAFTQDSGPRHLANAAGVPVAFFPNLLVPRTETGPYCDTEIDLSPGGEIVSPAEAERLYDGIDAASVAATLLSVASTAASTSSVSIPVRPSAPEKRPGA